MKQHCPPRKHNRPLNKLDSSLPPLKKPKRRLGLGAITAVSRTRLVSGGGCLHGDAMVMQMICDSAHIGAQFSVQTIRVDVSKN